MSGKPTVQILTQEQKARLIFEAPVAEQPQVGQWPSLTSALSLYSNPSALGFPVSAEMVQVHSRILEITAANDLPVSFMGYAPADPEVRIFPGQNSDWALMGLQKDPMYENGHKLLIPPGPLNDLQRIIAAGLDFDAVFIAHELPKGAVAPGQTIPLTLLVPPPPPEVVRQLKTIEMLNERFWKGLAVGVKGLALGAAVALAAPVAVAAGVAAVAGAAAMGGLSLDPIIFGLRLDRSQVVNGQYMAMWYYLTRWYWPTA